MDTDALVIGSGPVGAAVTWRLAHLGISVICVEQGNWFPRAYPQPGDAGYEQLLKRELNVNPNIRRNPADIAIDDEDTPIKPAIGNNVGGGSIYWAAHAPRFRPDDFTVFDTDGVAGNWPFRYEELAPYYTLNEAMMGVAYVAGDPSLPPRMATPFRYPQLAPSAEWMAGKLREQNWHTWPTDIVVGHENNQCKHSGPCNIGCAARRASGADRTYLCAAIRRGAQLVTKTRILSLEHDGSGRISAAIAERDGQFFRIRADKYILAANGIGTPHLLMLSQSGRFPNGLANGSGLLGRRMMLHPYSWVDGMFAQPFAQPGPRHQASVISLALRDSNIEKNHVRGARLQFSPQPSSPSAMHALSAEVHDIGGKENPGNHIVGFSVCAEDLPELTNRITLSEKLTDEAGRPAPKMVYELSANSRAILDHAMDRVEQFLGEVGAIATHRTSLKEQAGFHIMGTAVMGLDRETSVTNQWGRTHEIDNLLIADASVFVTSSTMNPTATAQAFALRTVDHLVLGAAIGEDAHN